MKKQYVFIRPTLEELGELEILESQRIFLKSKKRYELVKQRFSPSVIFYGKNGVYNYNTLFMPDVIK